MFDKVKVIGSASPKEVFSVKVNSSCHSFVANGFINPDYAVSLGAGMLLGAQVGSKLASRVDSVQLKQVFGLILVFPLVKMMKLGQIWLDPLDVSILISTIGDVIIWLAIVIPIGLFRFYQIRKLKLRNLANDQLLNEVDT